MTRPDRVRVGPLTYRIVWESRAWCEQVNTVGMHMIPEQEIHIWADMPVDRLPCCFLHEVMHGILWLRADQRNCTSYEEESAINGASYDIVMFWRDNPDAFEWWIALVRGEKDGGKEEDAQDVQG
jgi:hypothetical protein